MSKLLRVGDVVPMPRISFFFEENQKRYEERMRQTLCCQKFGKHACTLLKGHPGEHASSGLVEDFDYGA